MRENPEEPHARDATQKMITGEQKHQSEDLLIDWGVF